MRRDIELVPVSLEKKTVNNDNDEWHMTEAKQKAQTTEFFSSLFQYDLIGVWAIALSVKWTVNVRERKGRFRITIWMAVSRVVALAGERYDNYIVSRISHCTHKMHYWLQIESAQGETEKAIHHRLCKYEFNLANIFNERIVCTLRINVGIAYHAFWIWAHRWRR